MFLGFFSVQSVSYSFNSFFKRNDFSLDTHNTITANNNNNNKRRRYYYYYQRKNKNNKKGKIKQQDYSAVRKNLKKLK